MILDGIRCSRIGKNSDSERGVSLFTSFLLISFLIPFLLFLFFFFFFFVPIEIEIQEGGWIEEL